MGGLFVSFVMILLLVLLRREYAGSLHSDQGEPIHASEDNLNI